MFDVEKEIRATIARRASQLASRMLNLKEEIKEREEYLRDDRGKFNSLLDEAIGFASWLDENKVEGLPPGIASWAEYLKIDSMKEFAK